MKRSAATPRELNVGLLLSGLLMGLSFATLLIPLAIYHMAQVAATIRFRSACLLLLSVISLSLAFGVMIGQELLVAAGFVGLFWAPFFMLATWFRLRHKPVLPAALLLLAPVFLTVFAVFSVPRITDFGQYLEARRQEAVATLNTQPQRSGDTSQVFSAWDDSFKKFKSSPEYSEFARVAAFTPWQRLTWFMFDSGAAYLFIFGFILSGILSVVFLDHAFEQVERLKATVKYVRRQRSMFPPVFVENLTRMRHMPVEEDTEAVATAVESTEVVRHSPRKDTGEKKFPAGFVLPAGSRQRFFLGGYSFELKNPASQWELSGFSLPLPLMLLSVLFLAVLVGNLHEPEAIVAAAGGRWGAVIALGSLVSVILIAVVAVQGMLALYHRLTPLVVLGVIGLFLMVGMEAALDPFVVLGVFGSLGLLDYVYHFRMGLENPRIPA